jgi:hypothetical protein
MNLPGIFRAKLGFDLLGMIRGQDYEKKNKTLHCIYTACIRFTSRRDKGPKTHFLLHHVSTPTLRFCLSRPDSALLRMGILPNILVFM